MLDLVSAEEFSETSLDTSELETEALVVEDYQNEVLSHLRFQSSCFQFGLAIIAAVFIWKFLKQFF